MDIPPQPDFDTSFGSSQSLSDASSSQSELMDQNGPDQQKDEGCEIISAIECLSRVVSPPSSGACNNGNGDAQHLETLEESPTDPNQAEGEQPEESPEVISKNEKQSSEGSEGIKSDNNNGDCTAEDILSPCPCEVVPPLGAVTASCPPDVLAVSLTDSTYSQSLTCDSQSLTSTCDSSLTNDSTASANTVINTQASLSDSMSSSTLQEEINPRMADSIDSISSMERSQEIADS